MSEELIEHKLQSGKTLRFNISTFDNGKNLSQVIARELRTLNVSSITEIDETLFLQMGLLGISSVEIENAIWLCFDKAVVDGDKLNKEYFKSVANREDYFEICSVIAKANLAPFMKGLYAQFQMLFQEVMKNFQA